MKKINHHSKSCLMALAFLFIIKVTPAQHSIYLAAEGGWAATQVTTRGFWTGVRSSYNMIKLSNTGFLVGIKTNKNWMFEFGLSEQIFPTGGIIKFEDKFLHSPSNSSDAFTVTLRSRYQFNLGKKWSFEPSIGVNTFSINHASHRKGKMVYSRSSTRIDVNGTETHDTIGQYIDYESNRGLNLELGLGVGYKLTNRWQFYTNLYYAYNPQIFITEILDYKPAKGEQSTVVHYLGGSEVCMRIGIRRTIGHFVKIKKDDW